MMSNKPIKTSGAWIDIALLVGVFIAGGFIGYGINEIIGDDVDDYVRRWNGFYYENVTLNTVEDYQEKRDPRGDWIAVNVRGMSYEKCTQTVRHECGHEIWAEICEKDDELCLKGQELLNNYSRENDIPSVEEFVGR